MIGTISVTVDEKKVLPTGSMAVFAGTIKDPTGEVLLRRSLIKSVDMAVMERVVEGNIQRLEPDPPPFQLLLLEEYSLFDELQPKGVLSDGEYTFLYQPGGSRWPMFPYAGIFEVWFRFKKLNADEDDLRLIYIVNVGNVQGARRLE